jgi:hypothetical protein
MMLPPALADYIQSALRSLGAAAAALAAEPAAKSASPASPPKSASPAKPALASAAEPAPADPLALLLGAAPADPLALLLGAAPADGAEEAWRQLAAAEAGRGGGLAPPYARQLVPAAARALRSWGAGLGPLVAPAGGVEGAARLLLALLERGTLAPGELAPAAEAAAAALASLRGGRPFPGEAAWRQAADAALALVDRALGAGEAARAAALAVACAAALAPRGEPAAHVVEWGLDALIRRLPGTPAALPHAELAALSAAAGLPDGTVGARRPPPRRLRQVLALLRLVAREGGAVLGPARRLRALLHAPGAGRRYEIRALGAAREAVAALLRAR